MYDNERTRVSHLKMSTFFTNREHHFCPLHVYDIANIMTCFQKARWRKYLSSAIFFLDSKPNDIAKCELFAIANMILYSEQCQILSSK